jgi:hypothetical protein
MAAKSFLEKMKKPVDKLGFAEYNSNVPQKRACIL